MEKCKCYDIKQINHEPTSHYEKDENGNWDFVWNYGSIENVAVCRGTKECDLCSCGGDPRKCDFYEDIRNEANKMTTLDMMVEAKETGKTYVCGDVDSDNMRYNLTYGFHFMYDHKPWNADAFKYLNDVFASDMKWQIIPDNCFTIEEAEAKFNIKIVV